MRLCARRGREHARAIALAATTGVLVCLLFATDRRLGLHESANTRYRFHAIPVAISTLYHDHPHDYTALRGVAMHFHDPGRGIDEQIRETIDPDFRTNGARYYWVADDRGLADFVTAAFRIFGPRAKSLSDFWFLLLSLSLTLYVVGYWRVPVALILPLAVMLAWLAIASIAREPFPFPNAQGYWAEEIALYESRMFDGLALVAVLHLTILAGAGGRVNWLTWTTAIPQAAILIFLYHARSSLGWQFVALFSLAGARVCWWIFARMLIASRPPAASLARPFVVVGFLAALLVGLKQYQSTVYHLQYTRQYGSRTFWHNALMGLAYHPALRDELPMACCDDRNAVDLVLARMEARDPALDKNEWNWQAALNSLGNHNAFDWNRYESVAREVYVDSWREYPARMAGCYVYYKPREVLRQARLTGARLLAGTMRGANPEFLAGFILSLLAVAGVGVRSARDPEFSFRMRSLARVVAIVIPFSLIPAIAFYPALTTIACFYLLSTTLSGLLFARLVARVSLGRT